MERDGEIPLMRITKLQAALGMLVVIAGAAALIWQRQTITQLRAAEIAARQKAERVVSESRALSAAHSAATAEVKELRGEVEALQSKAGGQSPAGAATASMTARDAASLSTRAPDGDAKRIARMQERYDPFLRQRGFTPAQMDRFAELMAKLAEVRLDLQDSMRAIGVRGGTREIAQLRSKLTDPLWAEVKEMLGEEGYAAWSNYERTSYYRSAFLTRLTPLFEAASAPLSSAQADQLVDIIASNDRPYRKNETDLSNQSRIDWAEVARQAGAFMEPSQQRAIEVFAGRESRGER